MSVYIKLVNLGFGFGSARTAVESRLWSSQGWNFPRCTTTTENGREAASLSPLGMWLPLLTTRENVGRAARRRQGGGGTYPQYSRVLRRLPPPPPPALPAGAETR